MILSVAGAGLTASAWAALQFVRSNQPHDTYFVMPGATLLILFGVGALGDIAFRRHAFELGRHANLVWRTHLFVTTVLLVAVLVAAGQSYMTWAAVIVLLGATPLMLVAHGVALTAGGVVVLRAPYAV